MKHPLTALALALSVSAHAQTWTDDNWGIQWSPNPPTELVQGYRVHVEQADPLVVNETDVGDRTTVGFAELGLSQGRYEVWITAYNPKGESAPSARLPFVYVTEAPGTPGGLTAPTGLALIRLVDE